METKRAAVNAMTGWMPLLLLILCCDACSHAAAAAAAAAACSGMALQSAAVQQLPDAAAKLRSHSRFPSTTCRCYRCCCCCQLTGATSASRPLHGLRG
jgi:hypothetical protein